MVGSLTYPGCPRPGMPDRIKAANPLPENKKSMETGDAGRDGYTVRSRADRNSGMRPAIGDTDTDDRY